MASAAGVRAGGAFVEIFAKDGQFQQAMARVQGKMKAVGQTMQRFGTMFSLAGTAIGAPMVLAARQAATFEDAILGMRAAAGLTDQQVSQLSDEALRLSKAMGIDPAKIAQAFLELTKAGMSVEEVLAGAGKSAVEFARVSGVEMNRAAEFMKVSMNVFGISAKDAVDTLSAAADASETSIAAMVESFSQVGSAGKTFDQTLFGVSQAMAALAKYGIMGEEAGTAIKTLLTKLVAPTGEAHEALSTLGLTVRDFRDEAGKLLPIAQIAGVFEKALAKMGGNAEDIMMAQAALVDVFEQRGIKVIGAFADLGQKGFEDIAKAMEGNLPVATKFEIMMSGISGAFEKMYAAVQRLSIAFATSLGPVVGNVSNGIVTLLDAVSAFITQFPGVSKAIVGVAGGLLLLGTVLIGAGIAVKVMAMAFGALVSPIGLVLAAVVGGVALLIGGIRQLGPEYKHAIDSIATSFQNLNLIGAWEQINLNLSIALTRFVQLFHVNFNRVMDLAAEMMSFVQNAAAEAANAISRMAGGGDLFDVQDEQQRNREAQRRAEKTKELDKFYRDTIQTLREDLDNAQKAAAGGNRRPGAGQNAARRDPFRNPLGGMGAGGAGEKPEIVSLGTFASSILGQLGIGPKIDLRERAAKAQEEAAKAMNALNDRVGGFLEEMKKRVGDRQPSGQTIDMTKGEANATPAAVKAPEQLPWWADQKTFEQLNGGPGGGMSLESAINQLKVNGVKATAEPPQPSVDQTDKDIVSAGEKTAAATQKAADLLAKLVDQARRGGVAFA